MVAMSNSEKAEPRTNPTPFGRPISSTTNTIFQTMERPERQLTNHERMGDDTTLVQQLFEVTIAAAEVIDPDRGIDQHHATATAGVAAVPRRGDPIRRARRAVSRFRARRAREGLHARRRFFHECR